ncbi:hypothetical protein ACQ27_gp572 [Klebsiella phage K64-1]|uniref:Uncharacterized protein n=1 Tax=Klebsiella phage vB_KleM_RaK2 TaxID=1147094 RepID=H6X4Q0_9CAUD|nr:hypothetical protein F403_gp092 [Klebsiella phage vB_KleM_RaK2]YP_010843456.1 hypothetical protein ACQ27_gp572 [Klebsiella phage K64-1]AFA44716.1 hypothetical protein RaK2_00443 [Klebsiella phage vB_KleM_RaK2]QOE32304.1 hypothetical protein CPT_Muenster_132 [Klebsiella phage Muenster]
MRDEKTSKILKAIGGVLIIDVKGEPKLCAMEDLKKSKFFDIGSLFNAIRVLNNKEVEDYGLKWPTYRDASGEISNSWKTIQEVHSRSDNDWDFIVAVCEQLNEEVPEVLEKYIVLQNLDSFRNGTLQY